MSSKRFAGAVLILVLLRSKTAAAEPNAECVLTHDVLVGPYAAPAMKLSTLAGDSVVLAGGEAGWVFADALVLGGGGYATLNSVAAPRSLQGPSGDSRLRLVYGGARLGGIIASAKPIHAAFGLLLGGGGAAALGSDVYERSTTFFVVEPDLEAEINLPAHVRLALGGGWRIIGTHSEVGFTAARLGGPTATLALRVSAF